MGNWNISIRGVGSHHNGKPFDAEQMAAAFVDELKRQGHTIISAEVTYGGVEVLEDGRYGGDGGERRQARSLMPITLVVAMLIGLPAFAAEALPASEPTVVGQLLSWLAVIALGAVTMLMSLVGVLLSKKVKDSRIFGAINSLWVLAQTVVAHVEADLRPKIAKALADGKLTPEEATELKLAAIAIFKQQAGSQLQEIQKLLGLNDSAIGTFISGLIERAVASIKKPGPASAPTPVSPPNP